MRFRREKLYPDREFTGKIEIKFGDLSSQAQSRIRELYAKKTSPRPPLTGIERHWEEVAMQELNAQEAERQRKLEPLLKAIDEKESELLKLRQQLYELAPEYRLPQCQQAQYNVGMGNNAGPYGGLLGGLGGLLQI